MRLLDLSFHRLIDGFDNRQQFFTQRDQLGMLFACCLVDFVRQGLEEGVIQAAPCH